MQGEIRQIVDIPGLDEISGQLADIIARLERIEATMPTAAELQADLDSIKAAVDQHHTDIAAALDNISGDVDRITQLIADPNVNVDTAALRATVDSLTGNLQQAQEIAGRTPEA
jgi:ABC-type transporter Mla subunit MlaD